MKPPYSKGTQKLQMYELIGKRNWQFHFVFSKLRDPYSILRAYLAVNRIFEAHFGNVKKADEWLKLLMWVYNKDFRFFYYSDLTEILHLTRKQIELILKTMGHRKLLQVDKSRHLLMYTLTPEAHLLLQNFSREVVTAVMEVARDGSNPKKRKKI